MAWLSHLTLVAAMNLSSLSTIYLKTHGKINTVLLILCQRIKTKIRVFFQRKSKLHNNDIYIGSVLVLLRKLYCIILINY